jgi:hypothetical protein
LKDESGKSLITHYSTSYAPPAVGKGAGRAPAERTYFTALTQDEDKTEAKGADETEKGPELKAPADEKPAEKTKPEDAAATSSDDAGGDNKTGTDTKTGDGQSGTPANDVPKVTSTLKIGDSSGESEAISQKAIVERIQKAASDLGIADPKPDVSHPSWDHDPASQLSEWNVSLAT